MRTIRASLRWVLGTDGIEDDAEEPHERASQQRGNVTDTSRRGGVPRNHRVSVVAVIRFFIEGKQLCWIKRLRHRVLSTKIGGMKFPMVVQYKITRRADQHGW